MARRRIEKRAYEGQREVERLALWLNRSPINPEAVRVARVIYDIKDFLVLTASIRAKGLAPFKSDFQNPMAVEEIKEIVQELQERVLPYWSSTWLEVLWPPADRTGVADVSFQIRWRKGSPISKEETNAFLDVLSLTRSGNIHKIRECDVCGRWMFVKFSHGDRSQKHCSDEACKREWRNNYMCEKQREYRKIEKEKNARAKAAVEDDLAKARARTARRK